MGSKEQTAIEKGKRVKLLCSMANMTRRQLAKFTGIGYTTLQYWEEGTASGLSEKGAVKLIDTFNKLGVVCSLQWLLEGAGAPPAFADDKGQASNSLEIDKAVQAEIAFFEQTNTNSTTLQMTDDSMSPLFELGDIVGGVKQYGDTIKQLSYKPCIIETNDGNKTCRILIYSPLKGEYASVCHNIKTDSQPIYHAKLDIKSAAQIVWIRKPRNLI